MNVLIFVITMLMLLATLTYGRLSEFRHSQISQLIFEKYMQTTERAYGNSAAELLYDGIHKSTKNETPSAPRIQATSRISLTPLFKVNKNQDPAQSKQAEQSRVMLKRLMAVLYQDQLFFQKLQNQRPAFLDDLITSVVAAVHALPKNAGLKKTADLANLQLSDQELDAVFYKMLKGAAYQDVLKNVSTESGTEESNNDQKDEPPLNASEEFRSPKGYFSLLDFITLSPLYKIRVYLAPREVLNVVFNDGDVVDEVINERYALYKQLQVGAKAEDLSRTFESQFVSKRNSEIDPSTLNFSVSKTNPKTYGR